MNGSIFGYYDEIIEKCPINGESVYIQSHDGKDLGGNLFYVAADFLSGKYGKMKVFVLLKSVNEPSKSMKILKERFGDADLEFVEVESKEHLYAMATSKYLFTDVQFSAFFAKRVGQICVQVWHGTPLKRLGYEYVNDVAFTGAQKKSFIDADLILYPNEYTKKHMNRSYRLDNLCDGEMWINGYPRNAVFFDENKRDYVRKKEKLSDKVVYAYMPTWRGGLTRVEDSSKQKDFLKAVDKVLDDSHVMYVNMHRLMSDDINFSEFMRVKPFPNDLETYEFLAATDCLITDYSSVMFDYLCTRNKTILYVYDKKDYLRKQGLYFNLDNLPFPQESEIEKVIEQMFLDKHYNDDEVYEMFCNNDDKNSVWNLCQKVLEKQKTVSCKSKESILLYGGDLRPNEHTIKFIDYMDSLDTETNNICVCYDSSKFHSDAIYLQAVPLPYDLISIDTYKGDYLFDTNNGEHNCTACDLWKKCYKIQFHNIKIHKIVCFIDRYDIVLEILGASDSKITFVIDMSIISDVDRKKVMELADRRKITVVNDFDRVRI